MKTVDKVAQDIREHKSRSLYDLLETLEEAHTELCRLEAISDEYLSQKHGRLSNTSTGRYCVVNADSFLGDLNNALVEGWEYAGSHKNLVILRRLPWWKRIFS